MTVSKMNTDFAAMVKASVGAQHIRETGEPSTIRIVGGIGSKFSSHFDARRLTLLCELRIHHPCVYLWLNDWNEDLIQQVTASGWLVADRNLWLVPADQDMTTLFRDLFQGAWGLFFCDEPIRLKDHLSYLPNEPADLRKLLLNSNIVAAIVSWYDDTEWLVGWTVPDN